MSFLMEKKNNYPNKSEKIRKILLDTIICYRTIISSQSLGEVAHEVAQEVARE